MEKRLVVLAGPTAIGKTALGIEIAKHFRTEIISADSRQIYRETNIGTAVPSPDELAAVTHHFIQTVSLKESYNASRYEQEVLYRLNKLFKQHDLVLMVGGSGLYINAVCQGIDELPSADPELRSQLLKRHEAEGLEPLTQELKKLDPVSHDRIDLKNHMRVLKALEVSIQTGKPYSSFLSITRKERPFKIKRIALDMEREHIYNRINLRVDRMMKAGLLAEVEQLQHFRGYTAMKTVGYRELFRYMDGEVLLEEAVDQIKRNTRKFARKQLTWFRKNNLYQWFLPDDPEKVIRWIEEN
ncbi:MAG: tRNA (adenosine(37)-N6)-dimethylallyltransferase MiaA [Bacteroidales bacterium]|nr:tRNA (adenosine(37)-N6)-dimethylallyltransferase MiaA [Bacteroidales bacterium]